MSLKNHLITLLQTEQIAAKELATAIQQATNTEQRTTLLFYHIGAAYHNWLNRILVEQNFIASFEEHTIDESLSLINHVLEKMINYLHQIDEETLQTEFTFNFPLDGTFRKMNMADIFTHAITHAYYHKGQIISQLKGKIEQLPFLTYVKFASQTL